MPSPATASDCSAGPMLAGARRGTCAMPIVKLFINARLDRGARHAIAVDDGRISGLLAETEQPEARETIDLGGALVVPGFVEGHIHLDTSFYGDAWKPHKPCTNGFDVHERVTFQAQ